MAINVDEIPHFVNKFYGVMERKKPQNADNSVIYDHRVKQGNIGATHRPGEIQSSAASPSKPLRFLLSVISDTRLTLNFTETHDHPYRPYELARRTSCASSFITLRFRQLATLVSFSRDIRFQKYNTWTCLVSLRRLF